MVSWLPFVIGRQAAASSQRGSSYSCVSSLSLLSKRKENFPNRRRRRRYPPIRSAPGGRAMDRDGRPGWLPSLGFAFLSFNCGMAIYRSWDDPSSVAFVLVAYVALLLLFRCLHLLEHHGRGQRSLKLAVWGLSTLLTLMFSSKVAAIMPFWPQLLVWAMGIFTIAAGFYAFFLVRPAPEHQP